MAAAAHVIARSTLAQWAGECGGMAHAHRKFHELWARHGSAVGEQALKNCGALYDIEREVADAADDTRLSSNTVRTASSTTSGEIFTDFLMLTPFSSEGVSSEPGRFMSRGRVKCGLSIAFSLEEGGPSLSGPTGSPAAVRTG
ncbi:MAG: transposase [Rubrivivax sp.]